jgi:hypothetical protein
VLAVKNFEVGVTISRRRLTTPVFKTRELTTYTWTVSLDFSVDLTTTSSETAQVHCTRCFFPVPFKSKFSGANLNYVACPVRIFL